MPTKDEVVKELEDTKRKLAAAEASQAGASTSADTTSTDAMMKEFLFMMKAQQQAAEEDRKFLLGRIDKLMGELVDSKKKSASTSTRGPKAVPPPKLEPETSVSKFKAWRKAWDDYAQMCKLNDLTLEEQQVLLRSCLSLAMRDVLEECIGVNPKQVPDEILDDIGKFIRKKRSVVLDMVAFDNRKQKEGENFDSYLVAVQQLAQDADVAHDHCKACKMKCLDRRLAGRLISGIRDDKTRTKLMEEEKFPSRDKVVELCSARESAWQNNCEHQKGQQIHIQGVKEYPRNKGQYNNHNRQQQQKSDDKCSACGLSEHKSREDCPAKDETCSHCKKKGHTTQFCFFKRNQNAAGDEKKEGKKFGRIKIVNQVGLNSPKTAVLVTNPVNKNFWWCKAISDTGAEVCVAGVDLLKKLGASQKKLQPAKYRILAFNGKPETCLGSIKVLLQNDYYNTEAEVYICSHVNDNLLLSLKTSKALGYVRDEFPAVIRPASRSDSAGIMSTTLQTKPVLVNTAKIADTKLKKQKVKATTHYDAQARGLPDLGVGQSVRMQDGVTKLWDTVGVIIRVDKRGRRYLLRVDDGKILWRNRRYLRPNLSGRAESPERLQPPSQPMESTRGRGKTRSGQKRKATFNLPEGTAPTPSPRRRQRKKKQPDKLGVQSS